MGFLDRLRDKVKEEKQEGTPVYVLDRPVINKPVYRESPKPVPVQKPARVKASKPKRKDGDFFTRANRALDRVESGIGKVERAKNQSFGLANRGMDIFESGWETTFTIPKNKGKKGKRAKKRDPFDLDIGF